MSHGNILSLHIHKCFIINTHRMKRVKIQLCCMIEKSSTFIFLWNHFFLYNIVILISSLFSYTKDNVYNRNIAFVNKVFFLLIVTFCASFNCFTTGDTPMCGWRFEPTDNITGNISWRFTINSESDASELLENFEEMFSRYLY